MQFKQSKVGLLSRHKSVRRELMCIYSTLELCISGTASVDAFQQEVIQTVRGHVLSMSATRESRSNALSNNERRFEVGPRLQCDPGTAARRLFSRPRMFSPRRLKDIDTSPSLTLLAAADLFIWSSRSHVVRIHRSALNESNEARLIAGVHRAVMEEARFGSQRSLKSY